MGECNRETDENKTVRERDRKMKETKQKKAELSSVVSRIRWLWSQQQANIQLKCGVKTGFEVGHAS